MATAIVVCTTILVSIVVFSLHYFEQIFLSSLLVDQLLQSLSHRAPARKCKGRDPPPPGCGRGRPAPAGAVNKSCVAGVLGLRLRPVSARAAGVVVARGRRSPV